MRWPLAFVALAVSLPAVAACGGGTNAPPTNTADGSPRSEATAAPSASPPSAPAAASATPAPSVTVPPLWFVDATHGWTAAEREVLATEDGGYTWSARGRPGGNVAWLDFTSTDRGWATTEKGLFRTGDGGVTWQAVPTGAEGTPSWVQFVDDQVGWIVTPDSRATPSAYVAQTLWRTRDGGQNWQPVQEPGQCVALLAFNFVSATTGFGACAGQPGAGNQGKEIYGTADGGDHWTLLAEVGIAEGALGHGYATDIFFLNSNLGWLSTDRGGLKASQDGGQTWQATNPVYPADEFLARVVFVSPQQGWVLSSPMISGSGLNQHVGGVGLFGTTDGGQTWQQLCVGEFVRCGR